MKIIIKNIINENIDPEEKYVSGLSSIINVPYFYNLRVTDTPKHLWNRILSKVFNQEVTVSNNGIYDLNNNRIYVEYSDGYFSIHKFDSNNNRIYSKDSNGSWSKREFDSNNNIIYFEDSNGKIIDNRPNNTINENIDPEEKYVNGLSNIINVPYFYNLKVTDTPEHLWNRILSKKYNQEVRVYGDGIYDSNNNIIYTEYSDGDWEKREYDSNNNEIYYEDSDGYWDRYEYDSNNNEIYSENSWGDWSKREYDSNNNQIYYEKSRGYWEKREYDSNNNRIYWEDSDGDWIKQEYDSNNNLTYVEDSRGRILDKRNINENIDPEEKYVNGLSSIINPPYFYNLRVTDTPEHLWNRILSKVFKQEVTVDGNYIYDSNNNRIYSENSKGYWWKREFDSNNNQIYFENSDGDWEKREYGSNNNRIYYEDSDGYWEKREYGSNNNLTYVEDSDGNITYY